VKKVEANKQVSSATASTLSSLV